LQRYAFFLKLQKEISRFRKNTHSVSFVIRIDASVEYRQTFLINVKLAVLVDMNNLSSPTKVGVGRELVGI
jgi:hypothetical protein